MDSEDKGHDFRSCPRGEAEGTGTDALSPRTQVSFVVCSETEALTAKKDVRLKDCGLSVNPLGVQASTTDVPPLKGRRCETVTAPASPIPSRHSRVVPIARRTVSETVCYRLVARQISASRRDQSKTTSTTHHSSSSQPRTPSAERASSSSLERRETPPLLVTRSSDPFYESASPDSPLDDVTARLQPRDTEQPQSAHPIPSRLRIATTFRPMTARPSLRANTTQFDDGAVPMLESRGTLIPRSLGPRRETPRPVRDETPEATADVTSADRPEFDSGRGSVVADRPPGHGGPRPTSLLDEAYAEDPHAAARLPWATLAVLYLQAQAHWNFLHKHYPERCASVDSILLQRQWERVVFAAFHHVDVNHLSCGMFFFLCKGLVLEAALGPAHFLALLAVVVLLVGLVNIFYVLVLCELYSEPSICEMCMYTLAGVVVALDMIIRKHLGDTRICYGDREFRTRPYVCFLIELLVLASCSEKNSVPITCGYTVGSLLCGAMLGSLIVRIPSPPRYIYLRVVPNAPMTYAFFAALVFAFMCGPYPDTSTAAGAALTFRYPVRKPPVLWALYLEDAYQVAYVGLSLLAVGTDLERELGHYRFLCLTSGLLFAGHVLPEGLSWIFWKYAVALGGGAKPSAPRFSILFSSSSVLVGTLLALKTICHEKRRDSGGYQVALFTVPVPFWAGVLLELAYLHFLISDASTAVHVAGVLVGLIAVHCREGGSCFFGRIRKGPRRSCSSCSVLFDEERDETPLAPSQPADIWCQVCAARTASPTAYRVPETTAHRYPEVPAEDDTSWEDRP